MRSNGSSYVALVVAVFAAYFAYQWWFNPNRAIQRQLGRLAAALSTPATETPVERVARLARIRSALSNEVRVRLETSGPELVTRDAVVGALQRWTPPPGGMNVDVVDVQVTMDTPTTARAYLTVEMTSRRPQDPQPTLATREAQVALELEDGTWVVTAAAPNESLQRP
jgi:hypothetical protein